MWHWAAPAAPLSYSARRFGMAGGTFARNACYYRVRLAEALYEAGDVTGACESAAEAVPAVAAVRSSRTRNRLAAFRSTASVSSPAAREFADRYDAVFTA